MTTRDSAYPVSRRTFLRGVGVTMALPWLESLPVWGDEKPKDRVSEPPVRFACLFSGNGFHSKEWWAKGEGAEMELGKVLEPLRPFREKMLFLRGLYNQEALIGGIHSCQTGNLLTGAHLAPGGEISPASVAIRCSPSGSKDQTKVPSLVLGCEPSIAAIHKNYSMIYSSHISWSSPTTPTPLELYPALAFDRLFRDEVGQGRQERARRGPRRCHAACATRSASPTSGGSTNICRRVREVEQRIEQAGKAGRLQGWRPTLAKPDMPRPADGIPQDIDQHMRLMCDILVLAFRTDTTRVCTLKLNNDHSSLRFPHLKVDYMIHHLLSHTDGADWLKVNQFFAQQVAYIAEKLDAGAGRRAHAARQLDDPVSARA